MSDKDNASFLKMIGLEDDSSSDNPSFDSSEEVAPFEAMDAFDEDISSDEEFEVEQESWEDSQATEADYSEGDYADQDDEGQDDEAEATEKDSEVWRQSEIDAGEIFENQSESQINLNNRTAVYSEEEYGEIAKNLSPEDYEQADRLLNGIEEADASRATDIYASSFRNDTRETHTKAIEEDSEDSLSDFDESSEQNSFVEVIDEDSQLDDGLEDFYNEDLGGAESLEGSDGVQSLQQEPSLVKTTVEKTDRRTQAFSYSSIKSSEDDFGQLDLIEGEVLSQEALAENRFPFRIGRDPTNHIVIDDTNVSRFHCEIRQEAGELRIVDLDSTNGIKVNGRQEPDYILKGNERIQIAECLFEYISGQAPDLGTTQAKVQASDETVVRTKASPKTRSKRKFRLPQVSSLRRNPALVRKLAIGGFLIAGLFYMLSSSNSDLVQSAKELPKQALIKEVQQDLGSFKSDLEMTSGTPIGEMDDELVKRKAMERIQTYNLVPEAFKEQFKNVPAKVIKILLEDPQVLSAFLTTGGDQEVIWAEVRSRMQSAVDSGKTDEALEHVELLLAAKPDNQVLLNLQDNLRAESGYIEVSVSAGDEVTAEDRQKFQNYMSNYQQRVKRLTDQGQYLAAKKFSGVVKEKIIELIRKEPRYAQMAESAIAEWSSKINYLDNQIKKKTVRKTRSLEKEIAGSRLVAEIHGYMNTGREKEAALAIEKFLREYPDHPDVDLVRERRAEIAKAINLRFENMKSKVDTYIQTGNFKMAWDSIYEFLDKIPEYPAAQELAKGLKETTRARAAQFYNQARVFEFEADDLIAAEQYYKKTLETADPRGDLHKKAERRFAEVKRKSIQ